MPLTEEISLVRGRNRYDAVGLDSNPVAELTYRYLQQSNNEDLGLVSAHFDYVVEFATKSQTVVSRTLRKCDVKPTWRPLGASAVVGETGV